jgi:membrane-bound metal-dependent hydrolase YbcI (DUF457 family)
MKTELLETLSNVMSNEWHTRGHSASCSVAPEALSPRVNLTEPWSCPLIPTSVEIKDGWSYNLGVPFAFLASRGSTVSLPFTNCIFTIYQLYLYNLPTVSLPFTNCIFTIYQLYLYHLPTVSLPFTNCIFTICQLYLYHFPYSDKSFMIPCYFVRFLSAVNHS